MLSYTELSNPLLTKMTDHHSGSSQILFEILDSLPLFIGLIDEHQRYVYVNQTYVNRYGRPRNEIIGKTVEQLNGTKEYLKSKAKIDTVLNGKVVEFEYSFGDQSYLINYLPHRVNSENRGYFVVSTNITQLKSALLELSHNKEQLQIAKNDYESFASFSRNDRLTSLGAMAANLVDEISHPFSAINVLLDKINSEVKGSTVEKAVVEYLEKIAQNLQYSGDVIQR
ncbi:MAG: PAS domain-containing protein, partial [Planctomycetota bacterium]